MLGGRLGHRLSHLRRRLLRIGGSGGSTVAGGCGCGRGGGHLHRRRAHGLLAGGRAGIVRSGQQGRGVGRSTLGRLCRQIEAAARGRCERRGGAAAMAAGGNAAQRPRRNCLAGGIGWEPLRDPRAQPRRQLLPRGRRAPLRAMHPDQPKRSVASGQPQALWGPRSSSSRWYSPFEPQQPIAPLSQSASSTATPNSAACGRRHGQGACTCPLRLPPPGRREAVTAAERAMQGIALQAYEVLSE